MSSNLTPLNNDGDTMGVDPEEVAYLERLEWQRRALATQVEMRTEEQRERFWRQLEQAQRDVAEWPQFVRDAFPGEAHNTGTSPKE